MVDSQRVMPGDLPPGSGVTSAAEGGQGGAVAAPTREVPVTQSSSNDSPRQVPTGEVPTSQVPAGQTPNYDGDANERRDGPSHLTVRKTSAPGRRFAGLGLMLVGIWGALVPFFGPILGMRPYGNAEYAATTERLVLSVAPGLVVILAGVVLLFGSVRGRFSGILAGLFATAAGVWFSVGPTAWPLVHGMVGANNLPKSTAAVGTLLNSLVAFQGVGLTAVLLAGVGLASSMHPHVSEQQLAD